MIIFLGLFFDVTTFCFTDGNKGAVKEDEFLNMESQQSVLKDFFIFLEDKNYIKI